MHEQPASKAEANFHAAISNGKFHGRINPTTPEGSFTTSAIAFSPVGATLPKVSSASSAYHWTWSATSLPISCKQSVLVLPLLRFSKTASSAVFSRISAANRSKVFLRYSGPAREQLPSLKLRRAAVTALSISVPVQWVSFAITCALAGFIVSNLAPTEA